MKAQKVFSLTLLTFALAACGSGGGSGGGDNQPTHPVQQPATQATQPATQATQPTTPEQNQPNQRKKSRKIPLRAIIITVSGGLQAMSLAMISIPFACGEPIFS